MLKLKGTYTAMITPMKKNGAVDYEGFRKHIKNQLKAGIDGLVPLCTTSETPTLDEDEEDKMLDIIMEERAAYKKATGKNVPIIVGTGSNNTRDAVRYTQRAKEAGADAALVVTPYYNKPSQEGIYRHFAAVSKVGLPILVYNIQGRTGTNIATDTLARIADLPNIIGVKEASGNINQMGDVLAKVKSKHPNFAVLSGDDGLTLPLLSLGGDGVVSVVSNLAPKEVKAMVDAALKGKFEEARKAHFRLLPIFKAAFVDGNPTSIKYAMNVKGLPAGGVRAPLVEVTAAAKKVIKAALQACKL
ncbi:MAG: 4-hydroxy-tetrahydrodipicolinate synthase [Treponema sp.]|nr:4-hydroxy-tetrahydrodipicolinate synthase [Treponema sp.]